MKRFLSVLLVILLALSLLPGVSLAATGPDDDPRTVITSVSATTEAPITPQLGEPCLDETHFTCPEGAPYNFPDTMGLWFYNGGMLNYNSVFRPGTWQYRKQVRIDPPEAADYRLPCGDEALLTGTVNGEAWSVQANRPWGSTYTTADLYSPEYVLTAEPGTPLTFADDPDFDRRLKTVYRDRSITSFSVADHVWGGTEPYSFYKSTGPAWLIVSQDGSVSGCPNRVGDNDDLVIRVVDGAGTEASITIAVGHTWKNPNERTVVTEITATTDLVGLQPVPGESASYLTFTVPEDAPWTQEGGYWVTRQDGSAGYTRAGTFEEGREYQYYKSFKIKDELIHDYCLSQDDCTVKVNGVPWQVQNVSVSDGACVVGAYSPAVTCSSIIFTLQSVMINNNPYPFDGCFYGTDEYYAYRFTVDVLGEENDVCHYTLSGTSGDGSTTFQSDAGSNRINLHIGNNQTQPFTVNAVSAADPSKTASFTIVPTPRPKVTLVQVCWDPAQLRLSEEMDVAAASRLFRSLMQPMGEITNPYGFPMGDQAWGQLRYCGITYKQDNGQYYMITDTPDHTPLDADETYYIAIDIDSTWPYVRDKNAPPLVLHLKQLGGGSYSQLETAYEVVFTQNGCNAYFRLPTGTVTEKLWVEQASVSYDGASARFYETMTGAEATAALRSAIDAEASADEQAAAVVDECYIARKAGDVFVDQTDDASPLGAGEYYAVFVMEPQNGNSWNLGLMTREPNPIWPSIGVDNGISTIAPEYHWIIDEGDYTGRVAFARRVNVVPACPAPKSANVYAFEYGLGLRFRWVSPGYIQEGDPVPTRYRVERKAGDGDWELIGFYDYEPDAVGQTNGYDYDDTDVAAGVTYTYRVRTENDDACSPWLVSGEKTAAWAAPANFTSNPVTVEQNGGTLHVSWAAPAGTVTYTLLRAASETAITSSFWPSDTVLEVVAEGLEDAQYDDADVNIGWTYTYQVVAVNPGGQKESPSTSWRRLKATVAVPGPVSNLTADLDCGVVTLSWDAIHGAAAYRIERSPDGETVLLDADGQTPLQWTDSVNEILPSRVYTYHVSAFFGSLDFPVINDEVTVTVSVPALPGSVINSNVTNTEELGSYSGEPGVYIYTTCYDTVNGYHIYRCEAGEDDYILVGTAPVNSTWVDVTALPGHVYQYKIAPYNDAGEHPSPLIRTITRTPAAPEWVTAQALPGRVRLSWAPVECADGYQVALRSPNSYSLMMLHSGLITDTSFVAEGHMDPGSQYEFAVWSVRNEKDSASTFSNVITALSASAMPAAVESITAEAQPGKIVVSWPEAEGAEHYRLARQSTGTSWMLLDGSISGLTYTDNTVEAGKRYRYLVCGENEVGKGASATSSAVEALPVLTVPGAVESITAEAQPGKIVVTWTAAEGAEHYRIARQSTGTGWTLLDGSFNGLTYTDTSVEAGKRYRYTVCAENELGKGTGATSVAVEALPALTIPGAVESISAAAQPGKIVVTWTAVESADHYRIARQSTGTSWTLLDGNISGLTYTDNTVEAGKRYRYTVCGENELGKGTGATSVAVEALPALTIPGAVESISAEAQPGRIVVTWTAAENADHYRIARQSTGTAWTLLDGNVSGLTFTDDTVEAGKRYRYTVCGENELGKGTGATSIAVEALPALTIPGAVENISADAQPGRIVVTWTAAASADHYRIARQSTGTGWTLLDGNVSGLTFTDDTAEAGKRYRYTVCAENGSGKGTSATSVAVEALPALTVPGAVENISADAQPGKIVVTWTAAEGAEHYRIARQSTGTSWTLLDGNVSGLTFTDDTVEAGKRYRYTVCGENELGKGTGATSIAVEALPALTIPGAVESISASAQPGEIVVTWTAAEGAEHYRIARQSTGTGWTLLDGNFNGLTYTDNSVEAGKRYRYTVCGENELGKGTGVTSSAVEALPALTIPGAVENISAEAQPGRIVVTWTAVENADHYRIARQSTGTGWILLDGNVIGTTFEDTTAEAGKRYRYTVCAENELGKGTGATSVALEAL